MTQTATATAAAPRVRPWRRPLKRLVQVRGVDRVVGIMAICLVLLALVGPYLAPHDILASNISAASLPPGSGHLLGTDEQGRDVLSRVLAGARLSILGSMAVVVGFSIIGVLVAALATIGGSVVDEVLMRITDAGLAVPSMVLSLALSAALGPSLRSAMIAMVVTGWPYTARLLRTIMRETMTLPFVEGARILGVSRRRLMFKHVIPNSLDVLIVKWAGDVGNTILVLGALSFLGVGAQPPSVEWGAMIASAQAYVSTAWWAAFTPGMAITITAVTFGLLGESLQLRLNPEVRRHAARSGGSQ
ncbi:ABC transporter permease [Micromonospora sp. CB01531]|uniref:ABC transporter permease n=1 Tax=Micromonospora sp. CB01531 TaxID=1718947 RepID=UPI00093B79A1|nr:ABC transporter permease [Micromonospora sp. CB01531]OKI51496.1 ABC transporter permease [Micromonospora sp. CB01531]